MAIRPVLLALIYLQFWTVRQRVKSLNKTPFDSSFYKLHDSMSVVEKITRSAAMHCRKLFCFTLCFSSEFLFRRASLVTLNEYYGSHYFQPSGCVRGRCSPVKRCTVLSSLLVVSLWSLVVCSRTLAQMRQSRSVFKISLPWTIVFCAV
jgi:hypothetical protein